MGSLRSCPPPPFLIFLTAPFNLLLRSPFSPFSTAGSWPPGPALFDGLKIFFLFSPHVRPSFAGVGFFFPLGTVCGFHRKAQERQRFTGQRKGGRISLFPFSLCSLVQLGPWSQLATFCFCVLCLPFSPPFSFIKIPEPPFQLHSFFDAGIPRSHLP